MNSFRISSSNISPTISTTSRELTGRTSRLNLRGYIRENKHVDILPLREKTHYSENWAIFPTAEPAEEDTQSTCLAFTGVSYYAIVGDNKIHFGTYVGGMMPVGVSLVSEFMMSTSGRHDSLHYRGTRFSFLSAPTWTRK